MLLKIRFFIREFLLLVNKNHQKIKNKINYFSKRFAAKEAFSKATGFGISKNLNFKDIDITNDKKGKPSINIK